MLHATMDAFPQPDSLTNPKYTSISPSAAALIVLKAHTTVPYAREAAKLLGYPTDRKPDFRMLLHFENRYRTVDEMLTKYASDNVLEFSSGYSFRGLDRCAWQKGTFIDTDLSDVIAIKKKMLDSIRDGKELKLKGSLVMEPLNVFSLAEFQRIVKLFPVGPITIINEGLLPYFSSSEKVELAKNIRQILMERGGYWITADVYVKDEGDIRQQNTPFIGDKFRKDHKLDENRFESYEDAKQFFELCGFGVVDTEAWAFEKLSCLQLISAERQQSIVTKLRSQSPIRETWVLRAVK